MVSLNNTLRERYEELRALLDRAIQYYKDLSTTSKILLWAVAGLHQIVGVVIWLVGPKKIFGYIANIALELQNLRFGWLILVTCLVVASFPPLIGYGMLISVCGFVYGFPFGILPAAAGSITGATVVFQLSRALQKSAFWSNRLSALSNSPKWRAISLAITERGIGLVVLLRLCPIPPWVYSNLGFSLLPEEQLSYWNFLLATLLSTPRLFLHVFIGSRVFNLSDPNQELDGTSKLIDIASIVTGMTLSTALGWYVYKTTMRKIKESVHDVYDDNESLLSELR